MKDYMLVFHSDKLIPIRYTNSDFQSNKDSCQSTFDFVFNLGGVFVSWRSVKQSCIVNSTMGAKYIGASKVAKEVIWSMRFHIGLWEATLVVSPMTLFCDNSKVMEKFKEPRNH